MKTLRLIITSALLIILLTNCKFTPKKYYAQVKENNTTFDAIIVPGVPFIEKDSSWSKIMEWRVHWAKKLYDEGITKNIIFSGGAVYTQYTECKIMKLYAIEMGIPEKHIFLDSLAEHSTENVYYSYYVAKHHNFENIAVATDPYQTRIVKSFVKNMNERLNINIQLIPIMLNKIIPKQKEQYSIDFQQAKSENFINITETQSFRQRWKGTLGKNIDWNTVPNAYTSSSIK